MLVVGHLPAPVNLGDEPTRTSPGSYVVYGPRVGGLCAGTAPLRGLS